MQEEVSWTMIAFASTFNTRLWEMPSLQVNFADAVLFPEATVAVILLRDIYGIRIEQVSLLPEIFPIFK